MDSLLSSNAPLVAPPSSSFFGDKNLHALSMATARLPRSRRMPVVHARVREIFMPALSSTMTEGKIVSWAKSEGDKLAKGESVVVVESDKADMDVETFYNGFLAAILVGEGEVAPVGAAIGLLAETEEEITEAKSKAASANSPPSPPPPPTTVAAVEPPIPAVAAAPPPPPPLPHASETKSSGPNHAVVTPYAKKLAKQYKVKLDSIRGSGPYGRITAADVEAAAGKTTLTRPTATLSPTVSIPQAPETIHVDKATPPSRTSAPAIVPCTTVPFTAMQSAVSRNMVESLSVPTFRVGYTIRTDALDALYKKVKLKDVTMTALLAKAAALALAQHPVVNASCKDGKSFNHNSNVNIAVAVAMDGGLLTPVLQNADKVDLYTLSSKWKELVEKARAKQLQPHEYNSGTFTLSNLGMFGVDRFDAILPPGTGAIMAVGASQKKVCATVDGLFGLKSQMQVNVTADHRIIYGADVAGFLQTFAKLIENPDVLTL